VTMLLKGHQLSSPRECDVYEWIKWIALRNQPLAEVDDPVTRKAMRYSSICSKTLRKYMLQLVPLIQSNIKEAMANTQIALVFDGWTSSSVHYAAVFAIYDKDVSIL
jgi:hypothetical protein